MEGKIFTDINKLLNTNSFRKTLISASLYLTAYELLASLIIDKVKEFLVTPFENEENDKRRYKEEALKLNSHPLIASSIWLKKVGAISGTDIGVIERLKEHRNKIAHELSLILMDSDTSIKVSDIHEMGVLFEKIQRWWITDVWSTVIDEEIDLESTISFKMLPFSQVQKVLDELNSE